MPQEQQEDLDVIFGEYRDQGAVDAFVQAVRASNLKGTLYIGYPVLNIDDAKIEYDAVLVSAERGVVIFDLFSAGGQGADAHLERLYAALFNRLNSFSELRNGRQLGISIVTVAIDPMATQLSKSGENYITGLPFLSDIPVLEANEVPNSARIEHLNAAIQRISNLRPRKKRESVANPTSRGFKIKEIEKAIANLDLWQKRGSIEYVNGPQRIRGLAGSGKTVVLALKAAYLHVKRPDWKIVVTFNTRSLYQQFESLLTRFVFAQISDEPDWTKLKVMHAWGGSDRMGVYREFSEKTGVPYRDFSSASRMFGYDTAFSGACDEAIAAAPPNDLDLYDMILVDEAQDLPTSFFKIIYRMVKDPRRIVWAYDDLQNLTDVRLPSPKELFGLAQDGTPLVELENKPDQPQEDIVLPRCYRNPPWTLITAQGLGFGIHRKPMAQIFTDIPIWKRLGYRGVDGPIAFSEEVRIDRDPSSIPAFFAQHLTPQDTIVPGRFANAEEQYKAVAQEIRRLIDVEELEHSDILIILPNVYTSKSEGGKILRALLANGLQGHIPGVTSSRDSLFLDGSIAITHIFRAKGNEAPVVFLVNSDYCESQSSIKKRRNIAFTAVTRSRAWTYIFGVGSGMDQIGEEVNAIARDGFNLRFMYPTAEEAAALAASNNEDDSDPDLFEDFEEVREVLRKVKGKRLPKDILDELASISGGT